MNKIMHPGHSSDQFCNLYFTATAKICPVAAPVVAIIQVFIAEQNINLILRITFITFTLLIKVKYKQCDDHLFTGPFR